MEPLLIPPGKHYSYTCKEALISSIEVGQILSQPEDQPLFVILKKEGNTVTLGPLMPGTHTLNNLCLNEENLSFQIEAPEPSDSPIHLLMPLPAPYPTWVWIIPILILILIGLIVWIIQNLLSRHIRKNPAAKRIIKKTPIQKMDEFLERLTRENILEKTDNASSQFLYAEGTLRLRHLIQQALGFKEPGATRTEFIGIFKSALLKKKNYLSQAQVAQIESLFMQAKQVTFAHENPDVYVKKSFHKNLKDVADVLKAKILETAGESK